MEGRGFKLCSSNLSSPITKYDDVVKNECCYDEQMNKIWYNEKWKSQNMTDIFYSSVNKRPVVFQIIGMLYG